MDAENLCFAKISSAKTKALFFNAVDDDDVFAVVAQAVVPKKQEILPDSEPVDPWAHLKARDAELDQLRRELATSIQDPNQKLVRAPSKPKEPLKPVNVDELPPVARQAALAAARRRAAQ